MLHLLVDNKKKKLVWFLCSSKTMKHGRIMDLSETGSGLSKKILHTFQVISVQKCTLICS